MKLIDCIGRRELKNCIQKNPHTLEKWRGEGPAPLVDSCEFSLEGQLGYLAYYFHNKKWIIKSFKKSDKEKVKIGPKKLGRLAAAIANEEG